MQRNVVHKIVIVITVQFNSFIDFELSDNVLVDNSSLYNHIITFLLPSFSYNNA